MRMEDSVLHIIVTMNCCNQQDAGSHMMKGDRRGLQDTLHQAYARMLKRIRVEGDSR